MRRVYLLGIFLLFFVSTAFAGKGHPVWVEVNLDLNKSGDALVTYYVRYQVTQAPFHGFYFSGPQIISMTPRWLPKSAIAITSANKKMAIKRGYRNGKNTIEFANGKGLNQGQVTFIFSFRSQMARAGFIANTKSDAGKLLTVFDWAPSTWDHALEHYTVRVRYPTKAPAKPRDQKYLDSIRAITLMPI